MTELNQYENLMQQLALQQQGGALLPPGGIPTGQAPPPAQAPLVTPPAVAQAQAPSQVNPERTQKLKEAATNEQGAQGLELYLNNLEDPNSASRFLIDLGSRLLQKRERGQSQLGHIAASGQGALQQRAAKKAAVLKAIRQKKLDNSRLATEGRELKSADLRDEYIRSQITKNLRGSGTTTAAKVQEINQHAGVLLKNHPDLYKNIDEATEAAIMIQSPNGADLWKAKATAKFVTDNQFLLDDVEMEAGLAKINAEYESLKKAALPDPIKDKAEPGATPTATPQTREEWIALGPVGMMEKLKEMKPQATTEQLNKIVGRHFPGETVKPKTKAKPVAETKVKAGLKPEERKVRREEMATRVKKSREERKTRKATKAADLKAEKAEARRYVEDEFLKLSQEEQKKWFVKNRKHLTGRQIRIAAKIKNRR